MSTNPWATTEPAGLVIRHLGKSFGSKQVLGEINLDVNPGELVSLVGPSGEGKSTLLRLIAGLERADEGTVQVGSQHIDQLPAGQRPVGIMFQEPLLFPHMTVIENVTYSLRVKGVARAERWETGNELLEAVHLPGYGEHFPYELSGGQKQRVALARALSIRPRVMLLDEPLNSLDPSLRSGIREWLKSFLRSLGVTTLFVTHNRREAATVGDRIAVLTGGTIQQVGTSQELALHPATLGVARLVSQGIELPGGGFAPLPAIKLRRPDRKSTGTHPSEPTDCECQSRHLTGVIEAQIFDMGHTLYQVRIPQLDQSLWLAAPGNWKQGSDVWLEINLSQVQHFEKEETE